MPIFPPEGDHFHIKATETIIITPDIYVDGYEGVEQRVLELQAEMAKDFRECADLKQAAGIWIGRWFRAIG